MSRVSLVALRTRRPALTAPSARTVTPGAFVVVLLVLAQLVLSSYNQFLATTAIVTALVALSLGVVTGRTGMISLCQMSFAGLGAWVMLWLSLHVHGIPFIVAVVLSGLAMLPVSLVVSVPALRLRGVNLAVITIAFAETVQIVITNVEFPGQRAGFVLTRPGWLASTSSYLWLCSGFFVIFALLLWGLDRTRVGASWRAVRHSERASAALGRSVPQTKLISFAFSAAIAGVAGALLAGQLASVTVETFAPLQSLTVFAVAIMVAAQYPEGALLAGILSVWLPELLQKLSIPTDYANLLFAVGAIAGLKGGMGAAEGIRRGARQLMRARSHPAAADGTAGDAQQLGAVAFASASRAPMLAGAATADGAPRLECRNLSVAYGIVQALDEVSLTVAADSVVALIGPNGAGKSTLIDCVAGFIRNYDGEVRVAGRSVDGMSAHQRARAGIRRSFQQDRTVPELTVEQYVRLSVAATGTSLTKSRLDALLAFFDCPAASTILREIDVGTRRLIEVAAAVAAQPAVVMLDEPGAGLAASESTLLAERIAAVPARFGSAVLLVEHDMELVSIAASQVVVLDFGKVIAAGPPEQVLRQDIVVSAYLGEEVTV
jgi:branched-chain amino acid transport system permease protein